MKESHTSWHAILTKHSLIAFKFPSSPFFDWHMAQLYRLSCSVACVLSMILPLQIDSLCFLCVPEQLFWLKYILNTHGLADVFKSHVVVKWFFKVSQKIEVVQLSCFEARKNNATCQLWMLIFNKNNQWCQQESTNNIYHWLHLLSKTSRCQHEPVVGYADCIRGRGSNIFRNIFVMLVKRLLTSWYQSKWSKYKKIYGYIFCGSKTK